MNPFYEGEIEISGNSKFPYNINDLQEATRINYISEKWESKNDVNSYIIIDFKTRKFCYKGIRIFTSENTKNPLKGISIHGCNDLKSDWELICTNNFQNSNDEYGIHESSYKYIYMNPFFRFIRLQMTKPNIYGDYSILINNFGRS